MLTWLKFHFRRYRKLTPWAFCWRIAIEGTLVAHALKGVTTGLAAGLLTGFYLAFTYAHWREQTRWTAFWTTAGSHAIHNGIVIPLAFALGEI